MNQKIITLLAAIASPAVLAANDWYTIEVITFTQGQKASTQSEAWPKDPMSDDYPATALYTIDAADLVNERYGDIYSYHDPRILNTLLEVNVDNLSTPIASPKEKQKHSTLIIDRQITDWADSIYEKLKFVAEYKKLDQQIKSDVISIESLNQTDPLSIELTPLVKEHDLITAINAFGEYIKLPDSSQTINASSLTQRGYRILSRDTWRQYIPANSHGRTVVITGGTKYGEHYEIEGTITFDRIRYLHTDINFRYNQFSANDDGKLETLPNLPSREISSEQNLATYDYKTTSNETSYVSSQSYPIREIKRMRSEVTYYIDHPVYGIIIRVNRYEDRDELYNQTFSILEKPELNNE